MGERLYLRDAFQVPNWVVDELASLLDPEEFVVVIYLCRRTLGFHTREARISLTQFCVGRRTKAGEVIDRGTGIRRPRVLRALTELQAAGVVVVAGGNERNQGVAWMLGEWESVDWERLRLRSIDREAAGRKRVARAEAVRQSNHLGAGERFVPRTTSGEASGSSVEPLGGSSHEPPAGGEMVRPANHLGAEERFVPRTTGGSSHEPLLPYINPPINPVVVVAGYPVPFPPAEGGETATVEQANNNLERIGVHESERAWLIATPQRRYWAVLWAHWWPAVQARTKVGVNRFLRGRVEGACGGVVNDRQPPGDWGDYCQRQAEAAKKRAVAAKAEVAAREKHRGPAVRIADGARPLWHALCGAAEGSAVRGLLDLAVWVKTDSEGLVVALSSAAAVEGVSRRKGVLVESVRETIPEFPEVRFVRAKVESAAASGQAGG